MLLGGVQTTANWIAVYWYKFDLQQFQWSQTSACHLANFYLAIATALTKFRVLQILSSAVSYAVTAQLSHNCVM